MKKYIVVALLLLSTTLIQGQTISIPGGSQVTVPSGVLEDSTTNGAAGTAPVSNGDGTVTMQDVVSQSEFNFLSSLVDTILTQVKTTRIQTIESSDELIDCGVTNNSDFVDVMVSGQENPITLTTLNPLTGMTIGDQCTLIGSSYSNPVTVNIDGTSYRLGTDQNNENHDSVTVQFDGTSYHVISSKGVAAGTNSDFWCVGMGKATETCGVADSEGLHIVNSTRDTSDPVNYLPLLAAGIYVIGNETSPGSVVIGGQTAGCTPGVDCKSACSVSLIGNTGGVLSCIKEYANTDGTLYSVYEDNCDIRTCPADGDGAPVGTGIIPTKIVSGASPTIDAAGKIAVDTTDDQLQYYGGAKRIIPYTQDKCFTIYNPTSDMDNIPVWSPVDNVTITGLYCRTQGGTSAGITISDGTNTMEEVVCDGDGQADDGSLTNNTFTANERVEFDTGTISGAVADVNMCLRYTVDSQ